MNLSVFFALAVLSAGCNPFTGPSVDCDKPIRRIVTEIDTERWVFTDGRWVLVKVWAPGGIQKVCPSPA